MDGCLRKLDGFRARVRWALTCRVWLRQGRGKAGGGGGGGKKAVCVEVEPCERLVLGVCFALVVLVGLVVLEAVCVVVLRVWNGEVFAAIMSLTGLILGVLFGRKA